MSDGPGLLADFAAATVEQDETINSKTKNFPPFCHSKAQCASVNLASIPDSYLKALAKRVYLFFYIGWFVVAFNCVAQGFRLGVQPQIQGAAVDFVLSLAYVPIYIFGHMAVFILWYSLCASSGKKRVLFSYFFGFVLIAFEIIMAIGAPSTGAAGFGTIVTMFPNHILAGTMGVFSCALWSVMIAFHLYVIFAYIHWKRVRDAGGRLMDDSVEHFDTSRKTDSTYQPPDVPSPADPELESPPALPERKQLSSTNPFGSADAMSQTTIFEDSDSKPISSNPFD